jgi:E3 ubiquitin-protein ligase MYCBP2
MRWNGPRITFDFMGCPLCQSRIAHRTLADVLDPLVALEDAVRKKAVLRLRYENLDKVPELTDAGSRFFGKPEAYAMHRFAYYLCFKCEKPYYGGEARCGEAGAAAFDPTHLVCGGCLPHSADADCPKHGKDYIQFKCRFCCSEALFFCFGTTHFCSTCHDRPGDMQDVAARGGLPHCPAGPGGKQLPGTEADCPLKLGARHPKPGDEFCLGCSLCREATTF